MAGGMLWDKRKEKITAPPIFFFLSQKNDQCSHHQHPKPAFKTIQKEPVKPQASPAKHET
jgi:hypothetical protein